jgi:hypothetical protein
LKHELGATKAYLQSVIEQNEFANEELRAANEEIISANEELKSTNEELETAGADCPSQPRMPCLARRRASLLRKGVDLRLKRSCCWPSLRNLFPYVNT